MAQAEAFVQLLQREVEELEQLIAAAETRWLKRRERSNNDDLRPPPAVARFRERLAEVQKLLENLRSRFSLE